MGVNMVALVTGSSRGIGASSAILLAKNGYNVVINYLNNKSKAEEVAEEVRSYGVKCLIVKADLGSEQEIIKMFSEIDREFGPLNALVNNGAISSGLMELEKIDFNYLENIYRTNVFGVFICCREAVKRMRVNGGGSIVNITSLAADLGGFKMTAYASSKAAISNFTIGVSKEVAEYNIRINNISPGVIDTEAQKGVSFEREQHLKNSIPMKRIGFANEVAEAIFWLLSNKSSYITGTTLKVTGGK